MPCLHDGKDRPLRYGAAGADLQPPNPPLTASSTSCVRAAFPRAKWTSRSGWCPACATARTGPCATSPPIPSSR